MLVGPIFEHRTFRRIAQESNLRRIWICLTAVLLLDSVSVASESVHPIWFISEFTDLLPPSIQVMSASVDSCPPLAQFPVTQEHFAAYFDSASSSTEIYVGDFNNDCVFVHRIDASLAVVSEQLPIEYGLALLAIDLDRDGLMELVLQRGDGIDGFVDILSRPDWQTRQRFVFPGMNTELFPLAVDVDSDSEVELYLTPAEPFNHENAKAVIIDYDTLLNQFRIASDIVAPFGAVGSSAVADFDGDDRLEFITGNDAGYGLFEWRNSALVFIDQLPGQVAGYWAAIAAPLPGRIPCAILGSFRGDPGWTHSLLRAVGDNEFTELRLFQESTGAGGSASSNFALDFDCDGLDEMVMTMFPYFQVWEWDVAADSFFQSCTWDAPTYGNLYYEWAAVDIDQDGVLEFGNVSNGARIFRSFEGPNCVSCLPGGLCDPPPVPCVCACHADPSCDGIKSSVLDVLKTIDVAFRAAPEQSDPGPICDKTQTDFDCNGMTNLVDVVRVINVAFRGFPASQQYCDPCSP